MLRKNGKKIPYFLLSLHSHCIVHLFLPILSHMIQISFDLDPQRIHSDGNIQTHYSIIPELYDKITLYEV